MILWGTLVLAVLVTAGVCGWMIWHSGHGDRPPRDSDWGDWPSDQMGP
jgi:hypothetical protein